MSRKCLLSLVVPMYNEAGASAEFFARVIPIVTGITEDFEIICINDGSTDSTLAELHEAHSAEPRIKVLNLTRNFGKEAALTAGIDHATGDAVVPIDADLQDPPELLTELVGKWRAGCKTVIAVRAKREGDGFLKRQTAGVFYRILTRLSEVPIPPNAGDFRLLDRSVVDALKQLPERSRFMKGLYAWVGFEQSFVEYDRPARSAGSSKWKYWKLWNFALDGVFSFSTIPLRMWTYLGLTIASVSGAYGIYILVLTLLHRIDVPGYASMFVAVLFLGGINMIGLGILGEYVGRIFMEVKQRPIYLVASRVGFDSNGLRDN